MRYQEIIEARRKRQKDADKVRGKEPMPKAKPGRSEHPFQGRLVGESQLNEAEARIQHAEDIVFWEGSKGAARAIESLKNLEKGGHQDVTIKWDGSPALIFGRDSDGNFILTDKSGFNAKGYDGKAKSSKDLRAMLMNRPGAQKDPQGYTPFANNMADIFNEYEKAVPKDFRGFFKGDLLYFNTPEVEDDHYIFTPNVVTYRVKVNSEIGKRIGASRTGIVIHRVVEADGTEHPLKDMGIFQGNDVLVLPPVTAQKAPQVNDSHVQDLQAMLSKNASAIDALLQKRQGLSDLAQIFYTYLNSKVDTGLTNLAQGFPQWLASSKVSKPKQQKILQLIQENTQGFNALWDLVHGVMKVKDDIINQFEKQEADITAEIGSHGPADPSTHGKGGEGYVLAHPDGDIKLVPRAFFTKANRSVKR